MPIFSGCDRWDQLSRVSGQILDTSHLIYIDVFSHFYQNIFPSREALSSMMENLRKPHHDVLGCITTTKLKTKHRLMVQSNDTDTLGGWGGTRTTVQHSSLQSVPTVRITLGG